MYNIPQHEFEQLKDFFDKNDCFNGATHLSKIMNDTIEMSFHPDQYGNNYQQPLIACEGIEIIANPNNTWESPGISLAPEFLDAIDNMAKEIKFLNDKVIKLESMHSNDDKSQKHIPSIISTKEQWEEMRPEMKKKDRVLVHTTFDKALNVL